MGWNFSMSLSRFRVALLSASTIRKADMLTKLYLKSSKSNVSKSYKCQVCRVRYKQCIAIVKSLSDIPVKQRGSDIDSRSSEVEEPTFFKRI